MLFSRILTCCTAFIYCGVTVSIARTTGLSAPSNSSARGDSHSHDWSRGRSARRKKSERRPDKHRHSTRVDRNRPSIVLLPPWTDDRLPVTTTTTTTAAPSPPFIINVPHDVQNNTELDVQVPADYLSPPLVDFISQFQLAPDPDPVVSSESPGTSTASHVYTSTGPSTLVTLSVVVDSNDLVTSNDNYTSETPSQSLELSYYTFTPKENRNIQKPTTVIPENDLSPLIASESGDVRNFRFRQLHRANKASSSSEHETPRKKDQRQHKHARHACTRKGYIADVSSGCQVFHICVDNGVGESMSCPNGTLFNQEFSVCDWWYNVECK